MVGNRAAVGGEGGVRFLRSILPSHSYDLILRSRAQHGVSKDGHTRCGLWRILRDARKCALLRMRSQKVGELSVVTGLRCRYTLCA